MLRNLSRYEQFIRTYDQRSWNWGILSNEIILQSPARIQMWKLFMVFPIWRLNQISFSANLLSSKRDHETNRRWRSRMSLLQSHSEWPGTYQARGRRASRFRDYFPTQRIKASKSQMHKMWLPLYFDSRTRNAQPRAVLSKYKGKKRLFSCSRWPKWSTDHAWAASTEKSNSRSEFSEIISIKFQKPASHYSKFVRSIAKFELASDKFSE